MPSQAGSATAFAARALAVAVVYAALRVSSAWGLGALGLGGPARAPAPEQVGPELTAGLLVGLAVGAAVRTMRASRARQAFVCTTLLFLNVAAVLVEGAAFAPRSSPPALLPVNFATQLVVSALTALLLVRLFARHDLAEPAAAPRSAGSWTWRVAVVALTYAVVYLVTGAINYVLVTQPYYAAHAGGVEVPPLAVTLSVASVEGLMLALAVTPIVFVLPGALGRRAVAVGLLLFVLGGVVPLVQATELPAFLRIASAWEIFAQKFPVGAIAAWLLGPRSARA